MDLDVSDDDVDEIVIRDINDLLLKKQKEALLQELSRDEEWN